MQELEAMPKGMESRAAAKKRLQAGGRSQTAFWESGNDMVFGKDMLALLEALPEAYMLFTGGCLEFANRMARPLTVGKTKMTDILGVELQEMAPQTIEDFSLNGILGRLQIIPLYLGDRWATLVSFCPKGYKEEASVKGLLSSVGRELRDTMAIISVALELIIPQIENQGDPKLNHYLAMLCQNQRRVQRMAGNLGCFCAMVDEQLDMEFQKFDLVDICDTLIREVAGLKTNKDRKIQFCCGLSSLYTLCDGERIKRMLMNLISNSMKYTAKDGSILMNLSYEPELERIQITVTDDGIGMSEEKLKCVFRSFEAGAELIRERKGLGLGLPIAHEIARLHGGTLVVESREGRGTKVTVTLRKQSEPELSLHETAEPYGSTAQRVLLTELSDVLDREEYMPQLLD